MREELAQVLSARALIENVTPLHGDCGRICGCACCRADENGKGGMLLFPGEEALYRDLPGFEIRDDDTVLADGKLLVCGGVCDRSERPLACRFFPLRPTASGKAVMDRRAAWVCPLYEAGRAGLRVDFVRACSAAAALLCESPAHRAFLSALKERILFETDEKNWWR